MHIAAKIVDALLEEEDPNQLSLPLEVPATADLDPKELAMSMDMPTPRITTTYSTVEWGDSGDPDDYTEDHGYEDEEGQKIEVDEFDREDGLDIVDMAVKFLQSKGVTAASSSHFHPGIWYSSEEIDMHTGATTTYNFHLEDFTDLEEQSIFRRMFPRRHT
jgi:hypothetical protein